MNVNEVMSRNQCTGCGVCSFFCPANCITMESDSEGFLVPVINQNACLECGRCTEVCPSSSAAKKPTLEAYVSCNNNRKWTAKSSSGGMFHTHITNTYNQKHRLKRITFRDSDSCVSSMYRFRIEESAGENSVNHRKYFVMPEQDSYYNLFLMDASLRESCYQCPYAEAHRCGDLTIGDCGSSASYRKYFEYDVTLSTLLIHTSHGQALWNSVKTQTNYRGLDLEREIKRNHALSKPCERPAIRDTVYQKFYLLDAKQFNIEYARRLPLKHRLLRFISMKIPMKIKAKIYKLRNQ